MTPVAIPVLERQKVIPFGAWIAASGIFLLGFLLLNVLAMTVGDLPWPVRFIGPVLFPLAMAGYTLLVGYVYGDARRRGMRHVMWTLLAIFIPNGIGVIIYFILREPLLVFCSRCGAGVLPSHSFCPRCGAGVQPACRSCHRAVQAGWTHCAWCGNQL
jgi:RNA polymerase subunit RPABC4/transcription elongation factor Spt4